MKLGSTISKTVHAYDDVSQIVRHDKAARWFREFNDGDARVRLTPTSAARLAVELGMVVVPDQPYGRDFNQELTLIQIKKTGIKRCHTCDQEKPIDQFHRHSTALAGYGNDCATCRTEQSAKRRAADIELAHAKDRRWREGNHDNRRESVRGYQERERERLNAVDREWRRAHPEVPRAYRQVARAVANGSLVRPDDCERCGVTGKRICASHDDYMRPLDVEWLCPSCHVLKDQANPLTNYGEIARGVAV